MPKRRKRRVSKAGQAVARKRQKYTKSKAAQKMLEEGIEKEETPAEAKRREKKEKRREQNRKQHKEYKAKRKALLSGVKAAVAEHQQKKKEEAKEAKKEKPKKEEPKKEEPPAPKKSKKRPPRDKTKGLPRGPKLYGTPDISFKKGPALLLWEALLEVAGEGLHKEGKKKK